jgi:hypothetical protein
MRHDFIKRASILAPLALFAGLSANVNCSSTHAVAHPPPPSSDAGSDFQADPPSIYVAKVKNLLVGLPPTDAEIQQVTADPTQLETLIGQWQKLPQYSLKMKAFFMDAFQQTQITQADFVNLVPNNGISTGVIVSSLVQNITESFARTVLAMNTAKQPFTDTMTTTQVMMTPPLMELYAFLDTYQVDDNAKITDTYAKDYPGFKIMQGSQFAMGSPGAADPTSPNFMQWWDPNPANLVYNPDPGKCSKLDPVVYYPGNYSTLQWILYGAVDNHPEAPPTVPPTPGAINCGARAGVTAASQYTQLTADDFAESAWRMVTITVPDSTHPRTKFFDIPTLRTSSTLYLSTPHPGFFSTPAFFANWPTNSSNEMRVTANQALIVATGAQFDGTDTTSMTVATAEDAGLDSVHAEPGSACFDCHKLLDPTRAVLSSAWTYSYYQQRDTSMIAQTGLFAFEGVVTPVSTVADFGTQLANHPLFKTAWVQKLCYYATSQACLTTDPEFQRIVGVFVSSGYAWDTLVAEIFSSPLVTNAAPTQTTEASEIVSVSRRDHLCAALDYRLGLTDVCGLSQLTDTPQTVTMEIAGGLPSDGYGRGATIPVLPNDPTLFYRAGIENICEAVATLVIDPAANALPAGATSWKSTDPLDAIADFVSLIMGITPSDPRSDEVQAILLEHYLAALALTPAPTTAVPKPKPFTPTQALRSTFTAACISPSFTGIGM